MYEWDVEGGTWLVLAHAIQREAARDRKADSDSLRIEGDIVAFGGRGGEPNSVTQKGITPLGQGRSPGVTNISSLGKTTSTCRLRPKAAVEARGSGRGRRPQP